MYIQRASSYITDASIELLQLKNDLKTYKKSVVRRINRFILLSLIGAHKCMHNEVVDPLASVYVTTENGNLADTENILETIHVNKELPLPFGFVNTMSNTAAFYVAQSLGVTGKNITMSSKYLSYERGLELLRLDMKTGDVMRALICGVDESGITSKEGSGWLYVTTEATNALGKIVAIQSFPDRHAAKQWAQTFANRIFVMAFGRLVTETEKAEWKELLCPSEEYNYLEYFGCFDSITSCGIVGFIGKYSSVTLLHINRDESDRHVALVIERF